MIFFSLTCAGAAHAQEATLQLNPSQSTVTFTLGDVIHTVHGSFKIKTGTLTFNSDTGALSGEIAADATSGRSGNNMRDKKMHREILESGRYPDIVFKPDRVDGKVAIQGKSTLQVHGVFSLHGSDHEMTIPVQIETVGDRWIATSHFVIPYVKWGLKNPSTLILRASQSVEIDVRVVGTGLLPPAAPAAK